MDAPTKRSCPSFSRQLNVWWKSPNSEDSNFHSTRARLNASGPCAARAAVNSKSTWPPLVRRWCGPPTPSSTTSTWSMTTSILVPMCNMVTATLGKFLPVEMLANLSVVSWPALSSWSVLSPSMQKLQYFTASAFPSCFTTLMCGSVADPRTQSVWWTSWRVLWQLSCAAKFLQPWSLRSRSTMLQVFCVYLPLMMRFMLPGCATWHDLYLPALRSYGICSRRCLTKTDVGYSFADTLLPGFVSFTHILYLSHLMPRSLTGSRRLLWTLRGKDEYVKPSIAPCAFEPRKLMLGYGNRKHASFWSPLRSPFRRPNHLQHLHGNVTFAKPSSDLPEPLPCMLVAAMAIAPRWDITRLRIRAPLACDATIPARGWPITFKRTWHATPRSKHAFPPWMTTRLQLLRMKMQLSFHNWWKRDGGHQRPFSQLCNLLDLCFHQLVLLTPRWCITNGLFDLTEVVRLSFNSKVAELAMTQQLPRQSAHTRALCFCYNVDKVNTEVMDGLVMEALQPSTPSSMSRPMCLHTSILDTVDTETFMTCSTTRSCPMGFRSLLSPSTSVWRDKEEISYKSPIRNGGLPGPPVDNS